MKKWTQPLATVEKFVANISFGTAEVVNMFLPKDCPHHPQVLWLELGFHVAWRHKNYVLCLVLDKKLLDGSQLCLDHLVDCWFVVKGEHGMLATSKSLWSEELGWVMLDEGVDVVVIVLVDWFYAIRYISVFDNVVAHNVVGAL